MKILSLTHTICAAAGDTHFKGAASAAESKLANVPVYHPPGTVLDLVDSDALSLISKGLVIEWVPQEHGESPAEIAARMRGPRGPVVRQFGGVRNG